MSNIITRRAAGSGGRWRRGSAVASIAALSVVLAACGGSGGGTSSSGGSNGSGSGGAAAANGLPQGSPGKGKPTITLGTKNFSEEYLLGDLYTRALQAKGFTVDQKQNIGGSEVIDKAFSSGQIDMYPEYTGEIVSSVAGDKSHPQSAQETYNKAKSFEEKQRGATLLPQTPFEDIDVVVVKPAFAKEHNLSSIGDLSNVGPKGKGVTFAAQPPSKTRYQGYLGLKQAYGLTNVKFVGVQVGVTYSALDSGSANTADVFSTDGQLTSGKYKALEDPKHIMGFQHVAPVIKKSMLQQQGPAFEQTLNWVNSLLTTEAIQKMNAAVQLNHVDPATVAKKFLDANGLK
ncbi:MAG: glycine betaine ABC transporter substrate-binding protein [Sciscionella sp.]